MSLAIVIVSNITCGHDNVVIQPSHLLYESELETANSLIIGNVIVTSNTTWLSSELKISFFEIPSELRIYDVDDREH